MKYEWLLFDLDNTLLDFDASEDYALDKSLANIGITYTKEHFAIYEKINRMCWDDFEAGNMDQSIINKTRFRRFLKALNREEVNVQAFGDYYLSQLSEKAVFIEGAKQLLEEQSKQYKLGVVTNGLKQVQRPKLIKSNLIDYFKIVVVSDEIGVSKPYKAFFDYTFKEMHFPYKSTVLIIGDSLNSDIKGGNNYGIDTCWYNPRKKENLSKIKPSFEINSLGALKTLKII